MLPFRLILPHVYWTCRHPGACCLTHSATRRPAQTFSSQRGASRYVSHIATIPVLTGMTHRDTQADRPTHCARIPRRHERRVCVVLFTRSLTDVQGEFYSQYSTRGPVSRPTFCRSRV